MKTKESSDQHLLIITGMSGAGKTQAINCLEDLGYYCVDNLPPSLLIKFIELSIQAETRLVKVAMVIDVRGGEFFHDLFRSLNELEENRISYEILFLEASDDVLVSRFKESRRRHPLAQGGVLLEAIRTERKMLEEVRGRANIIVDTSNLTPRELNAKLSSYFSENKTGDFNINIVSFGYKVGIPVDCDIMMDVRFLPNPFYDPIMRNMTGEDQEVIDYVLQSPVSKSFIRRYLNLLKFLIPYYIAEGKTNLAISIGCTGGQHRSVVLADHIAQQLRKIGYNAMVRHRDVARYKQE
ncbi:MAG TPA: RNase adapter RapZ [Syntrophomonas sp.]|nr:RNase adapter RapZ [Syntrophomonas sp.]HRW12593.1 RNase adapter RapZ [Syntrophomonas sp.]